MADSVNITWHEHAVPKSERERIKQHKGALFWLTGLSGSGKSTMANRLEQSLNLKGVHTYLLDGDNIRHGLNKNLTFSDEDRFENIRRICEVSRLFVDAGIVTIATFVSPTEKLRELVRSTLKDYANYIVHINTSVEVCEERDVKGLYKLAREGKIPNFPGVNMEFETPIDVDLSVGNDDFEILEKFVIHQLDRL